MKQEKLTQDIIDWITKYGSDTLRARLKHGFLVLKHYIKERFFNEYGDKFDKLEYMRFFVLSGLEYDNLIYWKQYNDPSDECLRVLLDFEKRTNLQFTIGVSMEQTDQKTDPQRHEYLILEHPYGITDYYLLYSIDYSID